MIDRFGRILSYVRISVTDRCNFRCRYCMPEDGVEWFPHEKIMQYEDILFLTSVLTEMGVRKIRFTGGEPFVRKGFIPFLRDVQASFPDLEIALTTNGSLLSELAEELAGIRLSGLNISLDTLDKDKFHYITRVGDLSRIIEGIRVISGLNTVPLKINSVLIRNFNDEEVSDLLYFAHEHNALLRLIEFMPLDDIWEKDSFISAEEIFSSLEPGKWAEEQAEGSADRITAGPARYYRNIDSGQLLGIISAVSHHFCDTCNRLRISAMGEIRPCLFSENGVALKEAICQRRKDELMELILRAVSLKPRGWKHLDRAMCKMSRIGG